MPQAVISLAAVGGAIAGLISSFPVTATLIATTALTTAQAGIQKNKLKDEAKKARNRVDVLLRSATEPQRIIYGTRRVSGVLAYANVRLSTGTNDNSDLWQVIALAGHEIDGITDLYLDGDKIPASSINGSGEVTSGKYGPISGRSPVQMLTNLGSDSQTALSIGFADWSFAHRLRGIAHIATRFELSTRGSANLWRNGAPSNVRVTVRGKKVYDPRLDSTQSGGSGAHRVTDSTTWEYSSNPALCLADYLIDERLGMGQEGVTASDIDYAMVATAADQCDATVSVPGGTEPRYAINGVLFASEKYETNIRDILQTMNGQMTWSNGQFRIRAGEYEAPVLSFNEDDIIGGIGISAERGRETRINKIRGTFANAAEDYDQTQYLPVEDANLIANRDAGITLAETVDQPMVTSEYQAQRLAYKLIGIGNQQMRATIPLNYRAMNVTVGDRIQVSVESLSWSNKVFRVEGWKFAEGGFELDVIEDSSTAYDDPAVGDYSVRSASGSITFADPPVPSPSGLTATAERNGILVQWDEPEPPVLYDEVQVFASADSSWSNATQIASTRGTAFFHDLDPGTQRYYWVRSIDSVDEVSDRDPDSDTSSVQATAGAVGVGDVDGAGALASEDTADFATQVSGAEKPENGAQVNGAGSLALVINRQLDDTAQSGEACLLGIVDGEPDFSVDGFINWQGSKITVDRNQRGSSPGWTIATNAARSVGQIAFDTAKGNPFTVASAAIDVAFVRKTATGGWEYDNNSSWVSFDPASYPGLVSLGVMDAGSDVIYSGSLWGQPILLTDAPEARSTENTFFRSTTAPTANGVGDLWYDTDDDIQYRWDGSAWVQFAPTGGNTGIVVSDSGSGTTSASATITRGGAPTTILVNVEIAGALIGGANPFPATYQLRRGGSGGTVIKTWSSVGGFYEAGNGSTEPAVAEMQQSLVYIDSDTGTGSTQYYVSGPTTPYSESIEIEVTQTYFA